MSSSSSGSPLRVLGWVLSIPGAALVVVGTVAGWLWMRPATATASGTAPRYTIVFTAEGLLDQSTRSVWIPDDSPRPFVDFQLRSSETFDAVIVANADNFPHHDAYTVDFRVQLFAGDELVFDTTSHFDEPTSVNRIPIDRVRADRVRVTIESAHGSHGCLGAVRWETR
jgi:hypothetical protein